MTDESDKDVEHVDQAITTPPGGYCKACGTEIKAVGAICLKCGLPSKEERKQTVINNNVTQSSQHVNQGGYTLGMRGSKSKTAACLWALLLGGIGAHKFYLGQPFQGIMYFLFCWTFIPAIVGFLEGICYLSFTDERFWRKYG